MSEYYYGADEKSASLQHWKYLKRYKGKSGKWQYVYSKAKNAVSKNAPTVSTYNSDGAKGATIEGKNGNYINAQSVSGNGKKNVSVSVSSNKNIGDHEANIGKNISVYTQSDGRDQSVGASVNTAGIKKDVQTAATKAKNSAVAGSDYIKKKLGLK